MSELLAPSGRHQYFHEGRLVYEWDQTISEVNIYIDVPPGIRAKQMFCDITTQHLKFGLTGNPAFMDQPLGGQARVSESCWTLEDSTLHVTLTKLQPGDPWRSAIQGHELSAMDATKEQERLVLERFQKEHPGFDFSGAKFSGAAPNPSTFMGGMPSGLS
eukprot:gene3977-14056_t